MFIEYVYLVLMIATVIVALLDPFFKEEKQDGRNQRTMSKVRKQR